MTVDRPYADLGWVARTRGAYATFRRHHLVTAEGTWVGRDRLHHAGSVVVVPHDADGVVLVRQWREAAGAALLEAPAGIVEPGEDLAKAAARECAEETGYAPGTLIAVGSWWPSPGISDERMTVFIAEDLSPVVRAPDGTEEEGAEVVRMTLTAALAAVADQSITDLKTVAALHALAARRD